MEQVVRGVKIDATDDDEMLRSIAKGVKAQPT